MDGDAILMRNQIDEYEVNEEEYRLSYRSVGNVYRMRNQSMIRSFTQPFEESLMSRGR